MVTLISVILGQYPKYCTLDFSIVDARNLEQNLHTR